MALALRLVAVTLLEAEGHAEMEGEALLQDETLGEGVTAEDTVSVAVAAWVLEVEDEALAQAVAETKLEALWLALRAPLRDSVALASAVKEKEGEGVMGLPVGERDKAGEREEEKDSSADFDGSRVTEVVMEVVDVGLGVRVRPALRVACPTVREAVTEVVEEGVGACAVADMVPVAMGERLWEGELDTERVARPLAVGRVVKTVDGLRRGVGLAELSVLGEAEEVLLRLTEGVTCPLREASMGEAELLGAMLWLRDLGPVPEKLGEVEGERMALGLTVVLDRVVALEEGTAMLALGLRVPEPEGRSIVAKEEEEGLALKRREGESLPLPSKPLEAVLEGVGEEG